MTWKSKFQFKASLAGTATSPPIEIPADAELCNVKEGQPVTFEYERYRYTATHEEFTTVGCCYQVNGR
jgi:hypothetical protein